jgi:hypothetical protein
VRVPLLLTRVPVCAVGFDTCVQQQQLLVLGLGCACAVMRSPAVIQHLTRAPPHPRPLTPDP